MASITITIPDAVVTRVLDAMATRYGWSSDSGLTKAQFAKKVIIDLLKDAVKLHEGNLASQQAMEVSNALVDTDIQLT